MTRKLRWIVVAALLLAGGWWSLQRLTGDETE